MPSLLVAVSVGFVGITWLVVPHPVKVIVIPINRIIRQLISSTLLLLQFPPQLPALNYSKQCGQEFNRGF